MGQRFPQQIFGKCFFVTTTFKDRQNFGNIEGFSDAVVESLGYSVAKYNAYIIGYVLMPNHLHLLLVVGGDKLSHFMRDFKKFVAQKVAADLGLPGGGLWMPRFDRVVIYSEDVLRTKLNYIHYNPGKRGLVSKPEDWRWSSAGDYFLGRKGMIPVWKGWG